MAKSKKFIEWFAASPNAFGNNLRAEEGDKTGPMFYGQAGQSFLHQISKSFVDRVNALQHDKNYTDEGRRNKTQEHAKSLLAQLRREYRRFLDPLVQKYQKFDATGLLAIIPPRDAVQAVQRMELRQFIASQPGDKKLQIFQDALKSDDEQTLGAFFEKSNLYQLLGEEIIKKGRIEYLRKKGAGDILDAEEAGAVLTHNIQAIVDDLGLFAGPSEDAQAIHAELPKLDWSFNPTEDFKAMAGGGYPSNLPDIKLNPMSDNQRISAMAGK